SQIIDLKNWFFTIPLHPEDCDHFAFSVPALNNSAPMQQYQWTVLPQGMMNSLTACQVVVATAIEPMCQAFPKALIYHYMDDILVATEKEDELNMTMNHFL
ncbi:POK25 protein, partial [Eurystomus gularis]|nr:POK25 protein [Eurystomus gularis]